MWNPKTDDFFPFSQKIFKIKNPKKSCFLRKSEFFETSDISDEFPVPAEGPSSKDSTIF